MFRFLDSSKGFCFGGQKIVLLCTAFEWWDYEHDSLGDQVGRLGQAYWTKFFQPLGHPVNVGFWQVWENSHSS